MFLAEPEKSQTLMALLDPGSNRRFISRLYRALKSDRVVSTLKARAGWTEDSPDPLTNNEWCQACAQV